MKNRKPGRSRFAGVIGTALFCVACMDILPPGAEVLPPPALTDAIFEVVSDARGYTMAVGEQAQLGFTVRSASGDSIVVDSADVTFDFVSKPDSLRLRVSSTGLMTALAPSANTTPMRILIKVQYGPDDAKITRADTVYAIVTNTSADVTSISIHSTSPDSTRIGFGANKVIPVVARAGETVVPNVFAYLDTKRRRLRLTPADINPLNRTVTAQTKGSFWVYATGIIYGKRLVDSVLYTGLEPATATFTVGVNADGYGLAWPGNVYSGVSVRRTGFTLNIQPCGAVTWTNNTTDTLMVTLDIPDRTVKCSPADTTRTGDTFTLFPAGKATRKFRVIADYAWGAKKVNGQHLFPIQGEDGYSPFGNREGIWGIVRVKE